MVDFRLSLKSLTPSLYSEILQEKKTGTLKDATLNALLGSIILGIGFFFYTIVSVLLAGQNKELTSIGVVGGIIFGISTFVSVFVMFFIANLIEYFLATKIFGGIGSFSQQAYLLSLPFAGFCIIGLVLVIPCIGLLVIGIATLLLVYLKFLGLKAIHNLDTIRTVLVMALAGIFLTMFFFILVSVLAPK